jgi:hypothetical protein
MFSRKLRFVSENSQPILMKSENSAQNSQFKYTQVEIIFLLVSEYIVACRPVARQRQRSKQDNGTVNSNRETVFSVMSVPTFYKQAT